MNRTLQIILASFILAGLASAATSRTSTYSNVPRKENKEVESPPIAGIEPKAKSIKDAEVRPEEAFKYGVQEFALIAGDNGYFPARLIVRKNIPVSIFMTASTETNLCFVQDDFGIRRSLGSKVVEEVRFLPTKVGQYKFYCPVKEIQGTLIVRD